MNRLVVKIFGSLFLTMMIFAFSASLASAKDVLEFIDLPSGDHPQAALDPLLACRDGVIFNSPLWGGWLSSTMALIPGTSALPQMMATC